MIRDALKHARYLERQLAGRQTSSTLFVSHSGVVTYDSREEDAALQAAINALYRIEREARAERSWRA